MPHHPPRPPHAADAPAPDADLLAAITAGLAREQDLSRLLQRFLEPIVRLAGAHSGAVRVLSEDGTQLRLVSSHGVGAELLAAEQAVDRHCGHCGVAADGAAVVWATDLSACSGRAGDHRFFGSTCRRMLAVPLQHRGRMLGVYNLFYADAAQPAPAVQDLLRSVGELLGLALNNARLEREQLRATLLQERQAMAADVHDSIAQSLAFMKMRLPLLQDAIDTCDQARASQYCADLRAATSQAHASLRVIITQLRAPMDPQGLLHALAGSADSFRRQTGAELEFDNRLPGLQLQPEQEAQVFHIVQEALANVARHARAQHARLQIAPGHGGQVEILVEDDGHGLAPHAGAGGTHHGLQIMQERARRIGARLEIGPRDGGGTRVRLALAGAGQEA